MRTQLLNYKIKKKYLPGQLSSFFMFLIVILFAVANINTFDYPEFEASYYGVINTKFESGYAFFEDLFFSLGVNFDFFKLVLIGFSMLLVHRTVKRYIHSSLVWMFYIAFLVFPIDFFAYSLRNTIAISIVIFAFKFLLEDNKFGVLKFIIFILIAMQFHVSSFVFIVFVIIPILSKNNNKLMLRLFLTFVLVISTLLIISSQALQLFMNFVINNVLPLVGAGGHKSGYFQIAGRWGFLLSVIPHLLFFILLNMCKKNLNKYDKGSDRQIDHGDEKINNINKFVSYVYYSNILLTFVIPIIRVNFEFTRIFKSITPLYYIAVIAVISFLKIRNRRYYPIVLLLFITVIINYFIYVWPYRTITYYTLFSDNWIINLIIN